MIPQSRLVATSLKVSDDAPGNDVGRWVGDVSLEVEIGAAFGPEHVGDHKMDVHGPLFMVSMAGPGFPRSDTPHQCRMLRQKKSPAGSGAREGRPEAYNVLTNIFVTLVSSITNQIG
jgi:hypothetical protein